MDCVTLEQRPKTPSVKQRAQRRGRKKQNVQYSSVEDCDEIETPTLPKKTKLKFDEVRHMDTLQENKLSLKKEIVQFLKRRPNKKCVRQSFWNDLSESIKRPLSRKQYGVGKLSNLFDEFSDIIECRGRHVCLRDSMTEQSSNIIVIMSDDSDDSVSTYFDVTDSNPSGHASHSLAARIVSSDTGDMEEEMSLTDNAGLMENNLRTSTLSQQNPMWGSGATSGGAGDLSSNNSNVMPSFIPFSGDSKPNPLQVFLGHGATHPSSHGFQQFQRTPQCFPFPPPLLSQNKPRYGIPDPAQASMQFQRSTFASPAHVTSQLQKPSFAVSMGHVPVPRPEIPEISEWPIRGRKTGPPPGTKKVEENREITYIQPVQLPRGASLTTEQVNHHAADCIKILSDAGEHVSLERVEQLLLQKYRVPNFQALRIRERYMNQLLAVKELSMLIGKVNSYIQNFVRSRSLCTLHELGECCREFHTEKKEFDHLKLGPLQKLPLVYELFKFPQDEYVPEITSCDIMEHLNNYMDKYHKWQSPVDFEEFLNYLKDDVYKVDPFSLGIRIRSLPLAIQMLKKSKRDASHTRREVIMTLSNLLQEDIHEGFAKFKAEILQKSQDGSNKLRLHYMNLEPEVALRQIFNKFELLTQLFVSGMDNSRNIQKVTKYYEQFISSVLDAPLPRTLFHLSVCMSDTEVSESAEEFLEIEANKSAEQKQRNESVPVQQKKPPSKAALADRVITFINRCLEHGALQLSHLQKIEDKLLTEFDFSNFSDMGCGHFLDFINTNYKIKAVLEDHGGTTLGQTGDHEADTCFRPKQLQLLEFVCQARHAGANQNHVEHALRDQFQVIDVKKLGHGTVASLSAASEKVGKHSSSEYYAVYEAALCGKLCPSTGFVSDNQVGIQGSQTRVSALACLTQCPLLEDMASWSHWSLVFQPQHGPLREFVEKHGGYKEIILEGGLKQATSDLFALEVEPGKLLKLSSQCSPADFTAALDAGEPGKAAGVLVSLIAVNRGLESTPVALLATHMKEKLASLHARSFSCSVPEHLPTPGLDQAVLFVRDMLLKIPLRICVALANQVLLEPLSQVVGSTISKQQLNQAMGRDPVVQQRLQVLGSLLGIQEWAESFKAKCQFPADMVTVLITDDLMTGVEEDADLEEYESDGNDGDSTSDIDEILSDNDEYSTNITDTQVKDDQESSNEEESSKEESEEQESEEQESEEEKDLKEKSDKEDEQKDSGREPEVTEDNDDNVKDALLSTKDDGRELTQNEICQLVVQNIRREEFGEGIKLDEAGQKLMVKQQERQGRSLQRLSKDLYSKDTHFVLELIQNADDNSYTDTKPALKFVIEHSGVTVLNNETGFEENNIRALCDVGKSTKQKHKYGYIGQKGIGFKSVFRVTRRPEVHSNGYHICFDVMSGPMGYIMPKWLEEEEQDQGWQTRIVLPWTEEMKPQVQTHAARFNDIQPSLLLFLHRLKEITIEDKVNGNEMIMHREDLANEEVQIVHTNGTDKWLVLRKILDASKISLMTKSGVEVESTEIALAFSLLSKHELLQKSGARPGKMPVFAFLPLRTYGFRFIVQGDFDMPSSREDVDRDSSWNQWLRSEIPTLFIEAFESFKARPDLNSFEATAMYMLFVPIEGEVMDFFKPVASHILKQLRDQNCLPVISTDEKGGLQWCKPFQTVIPGDSLLLDVVSPKLLHHHMGLHYLHPKLSSALDPALIKALGIASLTAEHLLDIGAFISVNWDGTGSEDHIGQISKWLACIYRSLDDLQENTLSLNKLRSLRVLPLSSGKLVSLEDSTVFLLSDSIREKPKTSGKKSSDGDCLQKLYHDLNVVHPSLIATGDQEINSQVVKLLLKAGIKQLTAEDLIHSHIMPVLHSDQWKDKKRDVLVGYMVYIKTETEKSPSILDLCELRPVARLVTSEGIKCPHVDDVHFSSAFGNQTDLKTVFPGFIWTLVDNDYLGNSRSKSDVQSWRTFLSQLGVVDFLRVREVKTSLHKDNMHETVWSEDAALWPDSAGGYVIQDYHCPELEQLVGNRCGELQARYQQMINLFHRLDVLWEAHYAGCTSAQLKSPEGHLIKGDVQTSFARHLRTLEWVPALCSSMSISDDSHTATVTDVHDLQVASELHLKSKEVFSLLCHTVKYLHLTPRQNSSLVKFLQIKTSVSVSVVKDLVMSWCDRGSNPSTPRTMTTTMQHMKEVYGYLNDNLNRKDLQDLFHKCPAIFVPIGLSHRPADVIVGRMLSRDELWWSDPTGLFGTYQASLQMHKNPLAKRKTLQPLYPALREMFLMTVRVAKVPSIVQLIQLNMHIAAVQTLTDKDTLRHVLVLFSNIGEQMMKAELTEAGIPTNEALEIKASLPHITELVANVTIFPTKQNAWVNLSDKLMISDSPELEEMFFHKPGVYFLSQDIDENHRQRQPSRSHRHEDANVDQECIDQFLSVCEGLTPLSECITITEITTGFKPCARGQKYLHSVVGLLQRFLYYLYHEVYTQVLNKKAADLKELAFSEVEKLDVRYELIGRPEIFEIRSEKCVVKGKNFYFRCDAVGSQSEINKEVAKYFSEGNEECLRELRNFLSQAVPILEGSSDESLEAFLSRQKVAIGELPAGEEVWEIPLPVIQEKNIPETQEEEGMVYSRGLSDVDSVCHKPGEGQQETSLRSWPPASAVDIPNQGILSGSNERKKVQSSMWPPPEPPSHKKPSGDLPSHIRVAIISEVGETGTEDSDNSEAGKGHRRQLQEKTIKGATHPPVDSQLSGSDGGDGPRRSEEVIQFDHQTSQTESNDSKRTDRSGDGHVTAACRDYLSFGSSVEQRKRKLTEGSEEEVQVTKRLSSYEKQDYDRQGNWNENRGGQHSEGQGIELSDHQEQQGSGSFYVKHGSSSMKVNLHPWSDNELQEKTKEKHQFGAKVPLWNDQSKDLPYTDLAEGDSLAIPTMHPSTSTDENVEDIGRWGEEFVHNYLLHQKKVGDRGIVNIIWPDEHKQQGLPYDFEVVHQVQDSDDEYSVYIEVKTTKSKEKELFPLSLNQVQFAVDKVDKFQVYRVLGAGRTGVKLVRIDNVAERIYLKQLKLYMMV